MNGGESIRYVVLNDEDTQFHEETGRASRRRIIPRSAGRFRVVLNSKMESVEAARLRGVVRNALSSPSERDARGESEARGG